MGEEWHAHHRRDHRHPHAHERSTFSRRLVSGRHLRQVRLTTATLTVIVPIPAAILTQPIGTTVTAGQTATFTGTSLVMPAVSGADNGASAANARDVPGITAAGVVLAEVYDPAGQDPPVRLAAVSTLGHVGSHDRSLVSGFTISGNAPKRLLIRAVDPGWVPFGVRDVLADPQLTLVPAGFDATVASNDNWHGDAAIAATAQSTGAFALDPESRDAAVEVTLPPGGYTVTGSGRERPSGGGRLCPPF